MHQGSSDNSGNLVPVETQTEVSGEARAESRRSFIQRSAVVTAAAGAAVVASGSRTADAAFNPNFIPTLYEGWNARNFASIRKHENDHVAFLLSALGENAFPNPGFKNLLQPNAQAFARLARTFENTGTATYLGAVPLIFSPQYLSAAASIALVEARHSGYLNTLLNFPINNSVVAGSAPDESFESPQTPIVTAQAIAPFLINPAVGIYLANAISTTPSAQNDIAILRFALALEYLERDFYNANVYKIFRV